MFVDRLGRRQQERTAWALGQGYRPHVRLDIRQRRVGQTAGFRGHLVDRHVEGVREPTALDELNVGLVSPAFQDARPEIGFDPIRYRQAVKVNRALLPVALEPQVAPGSNLRFLAAFTIFSIDAIELG